MDRRRDLRRRWPLDRSPGMSRPSIDLDKFDEPLPAADRPAAEELRRTYEGMEPEYPADPTGIDCAERYESPRDQA
jgi:hypothetical protein